MPKPKTFSALPRRTFLSGSAATVSLSALSTALLPKAAIGSGTSAGMITRPIPTTGEQVPVIGMGTWITFNVGGNETLRRARLEVLKQFFALGGGMVDSSPMYGSAQDVMGWCLERIPDAQSANLIAATKIWTPAGGSGPKQMADARALWRRDRIDVMQVHNLVDWDSHLASIRAARDQGQVRYVGITTSHGSRHQEMEKIMAVEPLDFVQLTYNILDRKAERRLLPMAADRGIGVIVNRPFRRGALIDHLEGKPLPGWAGELEIGTWAQFLLKFIAAHPAVTCVIPATSQVAHMRENMSVLQGPLPDRAMRQRMIEYVEAL